MSKSTRNSQIFEDKVLGKEQKVEKRVSAIPVDIMPTPRLLSTIAASGHHFDGLIAEFVDNSWDARTDDQRAGKEPLRVDVFIKRDVIEIRDNGVGMDVRQLQESLRIASSDKGEGDMGQYGIGMKSAALRLGRVLTIETFPIEGYLCYSCTFDSLEIAQTGKWMVDIEPSIKKSPRRHGTVVRITSIHYNKVADKVADLVAKLGERYRIFLHSKELELFVNRVKCNPSEIMWDTTGYPDHPFHVKFETENGYHVDMEIGMLIEGSHRNFGFDLYKNGRMIESSTKELSEDRKAGTTGGNIHHTSFQWVRGIISFNDAPVNNEKSTFDRGSKIYQECLEAVVARPEFRMVLEASRSRAQRNRNFPKVAAEKIDRYLPYLLAASGRTHPSTPGIGERETHEPRGEREEPRTKGDGTRKRTPRQTKFYIRGRGYTVEHTAQELGPTYGRFDHREEDGVISVTTNLSDPFVAMAVIEEREAVALGLDNIAGALADIIATENDYDRVAYLDERERITRDAIILFNKAGDEPEDGTK